MAGNLRKLLTFAAGAGTFAGIAYTAIALARVKQFRKTASKFSGRSSTPISVLKPLCGDEPELFENLSSFCEQDYPAYQVIFGAADPADHALEIARAVARRFPDRDIDVVAGNGRPAANPKVGNLLGMIGRARHPIVAIADSDILAGTNYLHALASCFDDARTGAATCAYGGVPGPSLASQLGAMQVNDHFTPSVMVATLIEPLTYCFGATMAVRKEVLEQIGGLQAVAGSLADDYLLGKLVTEAGYRVALSPFAVQTSIADDTIGALWRHELRWARTIFSQRPAGYAGSIVTYALPFASLFALASRSRFSVLALAVALALRLWLHFEGRLAFAPQAPAAPWLIPVRDAFGLGIWFASFWGRKVRWKSDSYHLDAGGRMAIGPKEM